jgi:hypothetical protein
VPLHKFVWGVKPPFSEPTSLYAFLMCIFPLHFLLFYLCSYLFEFVSCLCIFYRLFSGVSCFLVFWV